VQTPLRPRSAGAPHSNGGSETDGGGVEEVKIDGFTGEHPSLLAAV